MGISGAASDVSSLRELITENKDKLRVRRESFGKGKKEDLTLHTDVSLDSALTGSTMLTDGTTAMSSPGHTLHADSWDTTDSTMQTTLSMDSLRMDSLRMDSL